MPASKVIPADLRIRIDPDSLGFSDTSELLEDPLPWIGQERAETAARFGLGIDQRGYNLFVLGEVGSGRSSLLLEVMKTVAAKSAVPPDLCYLHNFDEPERPRALRMPAGQGRLLRQLMGQMVKNLQSNIPQCLDAPDFKVESERITKIYKAEEAKAYAELDAFAEARSFTLFRESGHLVFTLRDEKGHVLTESEARALTKERRLEIDQAEQELRTAITRFMEKMRPVERVMNEGLAALQRQVVKPLLDHEIQDIRVGLKKQIKDSVKLGAYLEQVMHDVLDNLELFQVSEEDEEARLEALTEVLSRYRVNLVVDNNALTGAPVIVEDNPLFHPLFGSIEFQSESDVLVTDFSRIRAGSLLKAHGGFIMLHLRDLLADDLVWEKLRRFLRSGRLQIEESALSFSPIAAVSLTPEAVDVAVKIILIGSTEHYYALQELDPEFARHFRIKVDFAESFISNTATRHATAIFVAHTCRKMGLPHFSAMAVVRLLEDSHREVDDQSRQSAIFAHTEALVMEGASLCRARAAVLVEAADVEAALRARTLRHDYPEQCMQESITEGERLIALSGERVGQLNGLTQIDLGDYRFGFPVRVTARTFAGGEGLSASISFEQEYLGVEGDSASCAEFYVLISSLSGLPLKQGIAVTGAVNQHGEILPVGGVNEKIEGYFRTCETAGLDGHQGVLIPHRNRRHLMLANKVVEAVSKGMFHIYTAEHVSEGLELLTGLNPGKADNVGLYPGDSVLGRAQTTLQAYRRACQEAAGDRKPAHKHST
jgi:predicted ATP-dependent protease